MATREVIRDDTKPTRGAVSGLDILMQGLFRATQRADEREAEVQAFYEEQERRLGAVAGDRTLKISPQHSGKGR